MNKLIKLIQRKFTLWRIRPARSALLEEFGNGRINSKQLHALDAKMLKRSGFSYLIILAALLAGASSKAQTNVTAVQNLLTNGPDIVSDIGQVGSDLGLTANPTNIIGAVFGGISTTKYQGHYRLAAGALVTENVNNYVGVVAGVDHLWFGGKTGNANVVSGGVSLKASIHPIQLVCKYIGVSLATNTWAYQFTAIPYGLVLAGTPLGGTSNNGGLASIERGGVDLVLYRTKGGINFGTAFDYGSRTGVGNYSDNYYDGAFTVSKGF